MRQSQGPCNQALQPHLPHSYGSCNFVGSGQTHQEWKESFTGSVGQSNEMVTQGGIDKSELIVEIHGKHMDISGH